MTDRPSSETFITFTSASFYLLWSSLSLSALAYLLNPSTTNMQVTTILSALIYSLSVCLSASFSLCPWSIATGPPRADAGPVTVRQLALLGPSCTVQTHIRCLCGKSVQWCRNRQSPQGMARKYEAQKINDHVAGPLTLPDPWILTTHCRSQKQYYILFTVTMTQAVSHSMRKYCFGDPTLHSSRRVGMSKAAQFLIEFMNTSWVRLGGLDSWTATLYSIYHSSVLLCYSGSLKICWL